jgi:DNA invertase Pin-like site-specific DNA recombinase
MKATYVRTSSSSQNNQRQLQSKHPDELIFIDVISGAVPFKDRPAAKELKKAIETGTVDYISCESIDRIGRDAFNIQETIQYFNSRNVTLKVENLGIESFAKGKPNPIFKMISDVLANVAELTRNNIKESQAQGIAIAKAAGKYQQRATRGKISNEDFLSTYKKVVKELKLGVNSLRKIADICDVSLDTVQKVKKILKEQETEKGIN